MDKHGVPLGTLKECLEFLAWLNNDKKTRSLVAKELSNRLKGKYQDVNPSKSGDALTTFLISVSKFHKKLCRNANAVNNGKQDPIAVLDALLECIPKFLAVMYFLRYQVDDKFNKLGGGKWAGLQVGVGILGGELQTYLTEPPSSKKYGVVPGGFGKQELKRGYRQGSYMTDDLEQICEKYSHMPNIRNYFLDVYSTSVLGQHGTDLPNTANALALVRTFCLIVGGEDGRDGGQIKSKLDEEITMYGKSICWNNLKEHCEKLKSEFRKIFTNQRFSFTGFGRDTKDLMKEEFAKVTAKWLRDNLGQVKANLEKIKIDNTMKSTADYFTKNLFPYGFTFDRYNFERQKAQQNVLQENWANVINVLRQKGDGLERLKTILDGEVCPPEKKEDEDEEGTKAEGAQNQGKKGDAPPCQNTSQSRDASSGSASGDSATTLSAGKDGAAGLKGPTGEKGSKGPPGPVAPASSSTQDTSAKQTVQPHQPAPQAPPVPPPPLATGNSPGTPSQQGIPGAGSPGGDTQGLQPAVSPVAVLTQTPGVTGSMIGPTGGKVAVAQGGQPGSQAPGQTPSSVTAAPGATPSGGGGSGYAYYIEPC
ncbi:Ribosome-binding protein 1, putative [Babesia ovata]|uniref:Ribosome-binding protein 1, putative n=1 Tax=Babesia ovata TaxID=189622 RepID=A0A2H6KAE2_9APIC|nr:Ribosome-binding protein 1, putative [Babesia ovata]GBE59919.1 Ribosome-binding protein 1, putative [Babesia ovata]